MHGLARWFRRSTLPLIILASTQSFAAGYKMEFQSASVLADAGEAAVVEDAGTNWYNSAGLVYIPHQVVGSLIDLFTHTKYSGSMYAPSPANPTPNPDAPLLPFDFNNSGLDGTSSSNQSTPLPALHYAYPFKDRYAVGLSVVPAWGLSEYYGQSSLVRYETARIYTKTIDIAPSIAIKINNKWSLGAGPDFNYLSLQNRFNARTQPLSTGDSVGHVGADDWNTGWHLGALFRANESTRFGLNYRSKIVMHLKGYSSLAGFASTTPIETNAFTFHWVLPPTTTFSAYRDLNACWAIMGTIAYDQWSTLRNYNAQNYITLTSATTVGPVPVSIYQGFRNTFDLSVGTHYKLNDKWMFRGSLKYEPTPTGDQYRDVNFPDSDKYGVNIGSRYQFNKKIALDLIYGHVFTPNVKIHPQEVINGATGLPLTGVALNGHSSTSIDLVGVQIVYNI